MAGRLSGLAHAGALAAGEAADAQMAAGAAAFELTDTLQAMGNMCPTCGSHVDPEHFLLHAEAVQ